MAALSAREPTPEEMAGWSSLADVAMWANLPGDILDPDSPAGAILCATGAYEGGNLCTIEEYAAVDPEVFMVAADVWTYGNGEGGQFTPGAVMQGKARTFLRGVRLAAGVDWSKAEASEHDRQQTQIAERSWHNFINQASTAGATIM